MRHTHLITAAPKRMAVMCRTVVDASIIPSSMRICRNTSRCANEFIDARLCYACVMSTYDGLYVSLTFLGASPVGINKNRIRLAQHCSSESTFTTTR